MSGTAALSPTRNEAQKPIVSLGNGLFSDVRMQFASAGMLLMSIFSSAAAAAEPDDGLNRAADLTPDVSIAVETSASQGDFQFSDLDKPVITPSDYLWMMDEAEFEGRAAEILEYAKRGEAWAVSEMADYLLYGEGAPVDQKLAAQLYQMAADSDVPEVSQHAEDNLEFVERHWGYSAPVTYTIEPETDEPETPAEEFEEPVEELPAEPLEPANRDLAEVDLAEDADHNEDLFDGLEESPYYQGESQEDVPSWDVAPDSNKVLDRLAALDPNDFEGRAADIIPYALAGQAWAINDTALNLFYADNGSPQDQKLAVQLFLLAKHSGVPEIAEQATRDLEYIDQYWGIENILEQDPVPEQKTAAVQIDTEFKQDGALLFSVSYNSDDLISNVPMSLTWPDRSLKVDLVYSDLNPEDIGLFPTEGRANDLEVANLNADQTAALSSEPVDRCDFTVIDKAVNARCHFSKQAQAAYRPLMVDVPGEGNGHFAVRFENGQQAAPEFVGV